MKIKILFFIPNLSDGGAEKVLRTMVNNMDQEKFDITVHTIENQNPEKYLVPGIHYKSIKHCRTSLGRKLFSYWFRLLAELKLIYPLYIKDNYDIEVAYLECDATKVMAGSTNKNAVKLAWVHCDLTKKEGIPEQAEKMKTYYKKYDKVICVSQDAKKGYMELFGSTPESIVLNNVVDDQEIIQKASAFIPDSVDLSIPTFVAVGRLTWQKGFDRLIETADKLRSDGLTFRILILGEGPERKNLESMIQKYHLEGVIQLKGFQENPYPYMKIADCVVCSSRYEGLSTAVTEALILGKPVITTPCTGMDELLGNSQYGIIAEDTQNGLFNSMKLFLASEQLSRQYSEAAAIRGKDFSRAKNVMALQSFFISELKTP